MIIFLGGHKNIYITDIYITGRSKINMKKLQGEHWEKI